MEECLLFLVHMVNTVFITHQEVFSNFYESIQMYSKVFQGASFSFPLLCWESDCIKSWREIDCTIEKASQCFENTMSSARMLQMKISTKAFVVFVVSPNGFVQKQGKKVFTFSIRKLISFFMLKILECWKVTLIYFYSICIDP